MSELDETYDSDVNPTHAGLMRLSVAAKREGNQFTGWVSLGVTVVFTYHGTTEQFPAGIEDFAGITIRRFAERLAALMENNDD